jgi:hypothetical protein
MEISQIPRKISADYKMPQSLICSSLLSYKRVINQDRICALVHPTTIDDTRELFEFFFVRDSSKAIDSKSILWLGSIAAAAAKSVPLLVILPKDNSTIESPLFLALDR